MHPYNKPAAPEIDLLMVEFRLKKRIDEIVLAANEAVSLLNSTIQSTKTRLQQLEGVTALAKSKNLPLNAKIELNRRISEMNAGTEADSKLFTECLGILQRVPETIRGEFAAAGKKLKELER
jgi:paraquat-inducible protein B